jgi:opacity protein-like surface antigen
MLKSVSAVALAVALTAAPALAADKAGSDYKPALLEQVTPSVRTSCYVQGLVGGSVLAANPDNSALPASFSTQNWTLSAGLGCDLKMERFVVGALARIEIPVNTAGNLVDADKSWSVAARAGYLLRENVMPYVLIGYESADFSLAGIDVRRDGLMVGGGLEIALSKHISLTSEYTYTGLGSTSALGVPVDTDAHKIRLGLSWRFTSLTGE